MPVRERNSVAFEYKVPESVKWDPTKKVVEIGLQSTIYTRVNRLSAYLAWLRNRPSSILTTLIPKKYNHQDPLWKVHWPVYQW